MPGAFILASGALGAGSSLIGGGKQAGAATSAARIQANAAQQAAMLQAGMFEQIQGNLAPYMQFGPTSLFNLAALTGNAPGTTPMTAPLTAPLPQWQPTMEQLAATPGYQFTKTQALKAGQNQLAGQGLGRAGAGLWNSAGTGAEQIAAGLASQTYNQQVQNYLALNQQTMNWRQMVDQILSGQAGIGAQAATGTGQFGTQATQGVGNMLTSGAAATAAGQVGAANAFSNMLGGVSGAGANTALLMALNQAGLFTPSNTAGTYPGDWGA